MGSSFDDYPGDQGGAQILGFYFTLDEVNEGHGKGDWQDFHLRSGHITKVLGAMDDGHKTYFGNIRAKIFSESFWR